MSCRFFDKLGLLGTFTGALAFYFLLALVPLFILAATLVYNVLQVDITPQLAELLRELMPASSRSAPDRLAAAVVEGTSRGWFTLGFAGAVWASASFMNELARAIHLLFADVLDARAGGWQRALKAFGLMVLWCGALVGASMLFLLSHEATRLIARVPALEVLSGAAGVAARWVITLALLVTAVALTYRWVPCRRAPWKACAWGALVVAVAWMAMGAALTRLLPVIWAQSPLPLAFGSFLVTMLWAYACCWTLLLGALLVARWGRP